MFLSQHKRSLLSHEELILNDIRFLRGSAIGVRGYAKSRLALNNFINYICNHTKLTNPNEKEFILTPIDPEPDSIFAYVKHYIDGTVNTAQLGKVVFIDDE